jgi:hypothetical protein
VVQEARGARTTRAMMMRMDATVMTAMTTHKMRVTMRALEIAR